jgi:hypothetical protein
VWCSADDYLGIDKAWRPSDERHRLVGNNQRILRTIDLSSWNVFDLDAWGSPWEAAAIIAKGRTWAGAELGALILTDGGYQNSMFGRRSAGILEMTGKVGTSGHACGMNSAAAASDAALLEWMSRSRVRPVKMARKTMALQERGGGSGGAPMVYTAVIFGGLGAARSAR